MALERVVSGAVLCLAITDPPDHLPAEALGALDSALTELGQDPNLHGMVLVLRGGLAMEPGQAEALGALARSMETSQKPVVAVLEGSTGGALWALALGAHLRLASDKAQVVMAEMRHGLLPGAGVTQRLARLIGAEQALRVIRSTRPVPVAEALAMGAVDRVVPGGALEAAMVALTETRVPVGPRAPALRAGAVWLQAVREARAQAPSDALDPFAALISCVEAALLLPPAQGLAFEAVMLADLAAAPQTRALAHLERAEQAARGRLRAVGEAVKGQGRAGHLGLWSAEPERAELVVAALSHGLAVTLAYPAREGLVALLNRAAALQDAMVAAGTLTPEARDADWARLGTGVGSDALSECDLVLCCTDGFSGAGPQADLGRVLPGRVALFPGAGPGSLAEISVVDFDLADPPQARAVAALLDLARRLGWRPMLSRVGFVAASLKRCFRALMARFGEAGHRGALITAAMAHLGLTGAVARGGKAELDDEGRVLAQTALSALGNEAARLLGEGVAASALELDAVAVACGLYPRALGGPCHQADLRGLLLVRADLQALGGAGRLACSAELDAMIREGTRFIA